ncbi:MAG: hypothetical protein HZB91_14355, partial [Elusimicrobia bacterium]|nr:hypothetical protein [Elusimicrobiota bacterium]
MALSSSAGPAAAAFPWSNLVFGPRGSAARLDSSAIFGAALLRTAAAMASLPALSLLRPLAWLHIVPRSPISGLQAAVIFRPAGLATHAPLARAAAVFVGPRLSRLLSVRAFMGPVARPSSLIPVSWLPAFVLSAILAPRVRPRSARSGSSLGFLPSRSSFPGPGLPARRLASAGPALGPSRAITASATLAAAATLAPLRPAQLLPHGPLLLGRERLHAAAVLLDHAAADQLPLGPFHLPPIATEDIRPFADALDPLLLGLEPGKPAHAQVAASLPRLGLDLPPLGDMDLLPGLEHGLFD